ncbi:MerR family transcriptional regulator [Lysinibacillus sp. 54212]|uniref:MerR family transcriptional regulator n=1 Tax=Lysinibacillus sp. 54212 TaxID=3119829 RepID=UPI002FC6F780
MYKDKRRAIPLLPISTVMGLTNLTARQIRYYEEHHLIEPLRPDGNRRLYSLNNIDELLEIQELLEQGINIAGIKIVFSLKKEANSKMYKGRRLQDINFRKMIEEELEQS